VEEPFTRVAVGPGYIVLFARAHVRKPPLTQIVIAANSEREMREWASKFGVPISELRIAIFAVGTRLTDLRAYFDVSEVIPFPRRGERVQSRSA